MLDQQQQETLSQFRQQVESEIAAYLRFVATHPAIRTEAVLMLKQQAYAIETGEYRGKETPTTWH